jgi:hypothetical protein
MQEVGKPVFGILQQDTALATESGQPWGGGTWVDAEKRMASFRACFDELAERLVLAG